MAERHRGFLPVVAVGVASAVLSAVVGHHPWARGSASSTAGFSSLSSAAEAGRVPGATALALVLLACWGVVLVTRGRVRRAVAVLGALAGAGLAVTVAVGFGTAPDAVRDAYAQFGVDDVAVSRTAWFWLAGPVALVALGAAVAAALLVHRWPEMGRRYDAPGDTGPVAARAAVPVGEEQDNIDVWKAMDDGRDPTA